MKKELWRGKPIDCYFDSISITEHGGIEISHGGHAIVAPVTEWHNLGEKFLCVNPDLKRWKYKLAMWLLKAYDKKRIR